MADILTASVAGNELTSRGDPEGLVPAQWEDRQRAAPSSELRLMAAVMIDALRDFRLGMHARSSRSRQLARLAARWIGSRDRSWPYSFESICAVFDVDADDLRQRLARERMLGMSAEAAPRKRRNLVLTGPRPEAQRRRHAAVAHGGALAHDAACQEVA